MRLLLAAMSIPPVGPDLTRRPFAFIAEQSEWYRLDPREKLYYRKVKRAKLLEVSLMIEKDAAYSGTTVNVKNV